MNKPQRRFWQRAHVVVSTLALFLFVANPGHASSVAGALELKSAGEPEQAAAILTTLSEAGDAEARFQLGQLYFSGIGVDLDLAKSAELLAAASQDGHVNAPVWAGMAYENLGDLENATIMHRLALDRANHTTSVLYLARQHRAGTLANSSNIASARLFALAQAELDRFDAGRSAFAELERFSCFELTETLFIETNQGASNQTPSFASLVPDFLKCKEDGSTSELANKVVSAVNTRIQSPDVFLPNEGLRLADLLPSVGGNQVTTLPSYVSGVATFASDADSAEYRVTDSAFDFLNGYLGLPITSSIFPIDRWALEPSDSEVREVGIATSFFHNIGGYRLADRSEAESHKLFHMARQWHRGRFDHFHGWYSYSRTHLFRPSEGLLRTGVSVDLSQILAAKEGPIDQVGQIVRLYFDVKPPEDLRIELRTKDGDTIAVNSAELVNIQRAERDEGQSFYVLPLTTPAVFPLFSVPIGQSIAFSEMEQLSVSSAQCSDGCETKLVKLEVGPFDRQLAIEQARFFYAFNISPYGYTSHDGGDSWHVHGDVTMLPDYWGRLAATTQQPDVVHLIEDFTTANVEQTKGYLEDLLTTLRVRAVRPERMPAGRPVNHAIHDFEEKHYLYSIYRDKMNLATTYFKGAPPRDGNVEVLDQFLTDRLGKDAKVAGRGCYTPDCGFSHTSLVPALIAASLRRADAQGGHPFSHIWYTHFGAPTPSFKPTVAHPFTREGQTEFEKLARRHFGFDKTGKKMTEGRVLVASPSVAMRQRKLAAVVETGLLELSQNGDITTISRGIDPFLGEVFPGQGKETRDLAGLTLAVDDIFAAAVHIDEVSLPLSRVKRHPDDASGHVSVVDTSNPQTLLFENGQPNQGISLDSQGGGEQCFQPNGNRFINHARYLEIEDPNQVLMAASRATVTLKIEPMPQTAFGVEPPAFKFHAFATDPARDLGYDGPTVVHRLELPQQEQPNLRAHYIDLNDAERVFHPSDAFPVSALNVNGRLEEICFSVDLSEDQLNRNNLRIGPIRLHTPSKSDRSAETQAIVVGGYYSDHDAASTEDPIALRFRLLHGLADEGDANDEVYFTVGDGRYWGRVGRRGLFGISVLRDGCDQAAEAQILVEQDRLDLDVVDRGCAIEVQNGWRQ